ncbi:MAG: PQQ-binding-like beta-propeller repeat protein [Vicinamibacteria bacterium]
MRTFVFFVALFASSIDVALAENWPQWRGPRGNGVSTETGLPVKWGDEENVAWNAQLAGIGVSTPIVHGDRVFVSSQAGKGVLREGNHPTLARGENAPAERSIGEVAGEEQAEGDVVFLVEAFDRKDGSRLWEYRLPAEAATGQLPPVHRKHNLASPSPVTDGERVYAWFGTGQLVALDFEGKLVWQRHLGKDYSPFEIPWGHSSSPTIYEDSVILLCDHEPASYLLALDKRTGKEKWKTDRGQGLRSYSTPTVVPGPQGDELVVNSSERLEGYDPKTGKALWFLVESNQFPIPVPSFADGVIYTSRGYRSGPYMAIRPGGRGDIRETEHLVWHVPTGAPYVSSVVHYNGVVYMASDAGVVQAADAKTGERLFQGRTGGVFSAAPVAADGKVYFMSETGEAIVIAAKREFEILAQNAMDARFLASPAIAGGQLFLRSDDRLICVGQPSGSSTGSPVED